VLVRGAEDVTLASRLWMLFEGRWTIAGIATTILAVAAAYLFFATPIFRATVSLQVEDRTRSLAGLEELSNIFSERAPAETEIEILLSRMLLGRVVDELGLDLRVEPRRFPILGPRLAARYQGSQPAPPFLGISSFAWGGERIKVGRLDVSDDLLDEPLVLTAAEGARFGVEDPGSGLRLDGAVGAAASATDGPRRIEVFVAELLARPGTKFVVKKLRRDDVIDRLQKDLQVAEKGKKTGILVATLDGPDPVRIAAILTTLSNAYLRQNVERKSAEAAKTLEFLESQLPIVKTNLDAAQSAFNAFQVKRGVVDLTSETTSMLNRSVELDRALQELDMQRAELRQRFTGNHPAVASLNEKSQQLRSERAAIAAKMREVPAAEVDSARLVRDVKSASELYTLLLNKAQELRVVKSGTVGNVRILDRPVIARRPERPKPLLVLVIAVVLGLAAGVTGVFLRKALAQGAEDAEEIEAGTGLPVYATIPHSDKLAGHPRAAGAAAARASFVLAATEPGDIAVENLRSLRTSLQFALVESRNNVVAIGGPGPGVGKSFVCANLAWVVATAERRVLLIDCDLRRGGVHHAFGVERKPGVSDVISGAVTVQQAIRATSNPHLDILTTGRIPPNPSELLASHAFEQLLAWASQSYGFVIADTPPILAVTDAALVSRLAGVNLLVLRAGQHPIREISLAVKRLAQSGVKVQGAVLNDVRSVRGRYGKYGRYQRYEYRSSHSEPRKS
jgi:tyrosine-protein kinase Etk/Wzc